MRTRHKTQYPGRKRTSSLGYVLVYLPDNPMADVNGEVYEHRLVLSEELGRPLTSDEVSHHINGVRNDNRIENLMYFSSHSEHRVYEIGPRCKYGHEFTVDNTVTRFSHGRPFRQCVECERRNGREKARRRRGQAQTA